MPSPLETTGSAWPADTDELIALQQQLAALRPDPWVPPVGPLLVGACFLCFQRGYSGPGAPGEPAWAAATLARGTKLVEVTTVAGVAGAGYEPGLMAQREGALLEAAVRALRAVPDVLLVNATGRDHPRRAGLALHLGWALGVPSVGVTHRTLLADGSWPGERKGERAPLTIDGEIVGYWLRTRAGARPIAVDAAWRTFAETAVAVVLRTVRRARTPEPLRQARHGARLARARSQIPIDPDENRE